MEQKTGLRTIHRPQDFAGVLNKLLEDQGFGKWKKQATERMLRIIHTFGILCAPLFTHKQKVLWVTDDDDIVAQMYRGIGDHIS